jgi:hypothetical protein
MGFNIGELRGLSCKVQELNWRQSILIESWLIFTNNHNGLLKMSDHLLDVVLELVGTKVARWGPHRWNNGPNDWFLEQSAEKADRH